MGRVRDIDAQRRILDATVELIGARGTGVVRIDDIARAAGVGKQTIYRWWPSKHAVIIDAILDQSTKETPFRDTGDARHDLRAHMRGVARLFASPLGELIKELVVEASTDRTVADDFVERFWQPRRQLSTAWLRRSVERGEVRSGLDAEAVLDTIYSPLWARLLIGHKPITLKLVDDVLAVVWPGLSAQH